MLRKIAENNFNIFLTVNKNLRFQQNVKGTQVSLIVLDTVRNKIEEIEAIKELITKSFDSINASEIIIINSTE